VLVSGSKLAQQLEAADAGQLEVDQRSVRRTLAHVFEHTFGAGERADAGP
jgi:hypothetical protein